MQNQEVQEKKQLLLLVNQTVDFSKKYLEKNKYGYVNKLLDLVINKTVVEEQSSTQQGGNKNLVI